MPQQQPEIDSPSANVIELRKIHETLLLGFAAFTLVGGVLFSQMTSGSSQTNPLVPLCYCFSVLFSVLFLRSWAPRVFFHTVLGQSIKAAYVQVTSQTQTNAGEQNTKPLP